MSVCWVILQPYIELRGITFQGLGLVKVFVSRFVWVFFFKGTGSTRYPEAPPALSSLFIKEPD